VYKDGVATGITLNGTGNALAFAIPDTELSAVGTYNFTVYAVNGNCTPVFMTTSIDIEVHEAAEVEAGTNQPLCGGEKATLTGSSFDGSATEATWTIFNQPLGGDGVLGHTIATTQPDTVTFTATVAGAYVLRLTTDNPTGPCVAVSDDVTITVSPAPTVEAGNAQDLCGGDDATLTGSSFGGSATEATWTIINQPLGGDGALGHTLATTQPDTVTFTATVPGAYILRLTTDNPTGPCVAVSDDVTITVFEAPEVEAGANKPLCADEKVILSGSSFDGSATEATWTIFNQPLGGDGALGHTIATTQPDTVTFTATVVGTYILRLTTNDPAGICVAVSDDVTITVSPAPTVNAGGDKNLCASEDVTLTGSSFGGSATEATWTIINQPLGGDGQLGFTLATDQPDTVTFTASVTGVYTLRLTTDDPTGPCVPEVDEMTVTVADAPTVEAGSNKPLCAGEKVTLAGSSFGGAASEVTWTIFNQPLGGDGALGHTIATTQPDTVTFTATVVGTYILRLTTNDPAGICVAVSDEVTITVSDAPTVDAGSDQSVCAEDPYVLTGSSIGGSASTGTWSIFAQPVGGDGQLRFTLATDQPDTVTFSASVIGVYTLRLTTDDPTGPCDPIFDDVEITIEPSAIATAGSNQTICANISYQLTGSSVGGAASLGTWSILTQPTGGNGQLGYTGATDQPDTVTFKAAVAGDYQLVLTTDDPTGPCLEATDTITIKITPIPVLATGQSKTVCAYQNVAYEILLTPANLPANTVFSWLDPDGAGPASAGVNVPMGVAGTRHINDVFTNAGTITYVVTPSVGLCQGVPRNVVITVNPTPVFATVATTPQICSGENLNYTVTISPPGPTASTLLSWPDPDGPGPATSRVNVVSTNTPHIVDKLTNNTTTSILVRYAIKATNNFGCSTPSTDFDFIVTPGAVSEAGANKITCPEDKVVLAGADISGLAGLITDGTWSIISQPLGGDGKFGYEVLIPTLITARPDTVTFIASVAGDYILRLTSEDPAGSCPAVTDDVTITVLDENNLLCKGGSGGPGNVNCHAFIGDYNNPIIVSPSCLGDNGSITFIANVDLAVTLRDSTRTPIEFRDGPKSLNLVTGRTFTFSGLEPSDNYFFEVIKTGTTDVCYVSAPLPGQTSVTASIDPLTIEGPECFGQPGGKAVLTASGTRTGLYFYSLDGITWDPFSNGPRHDLTDLPPATFNVLVSDVANPVCYESVQITVPNKNPEIDVTFGTTPATCDGADGAITNIVPSGGSGSGYQFSIDDGVSFGNTAQFLSLTGGVYDLIIRDGLGCLDTTEAAITFPGFIDANITVTSANCTNNGNSGSIKVTINDPGTYQVALSTDQFNEPEDDQYEDYKNPFVTFDELSRGRYFVYMKSSASVCPTRSAPIEVFGVYAISFEIEPQCDNNELSISLINIVAEPEIPFEIKIFRKFTSELVESIPVVSVPATGSIYLDKTEHSFLQFSDEYQIQITQINTVVFCRVQSDLIDLNVPDDLAAIAVATVQSYPDEASGSLQIVHITGGIRPYEARIELDSASSLALPSYQSNFEEIELNDRQQFQKDYPKIPPGRYTVDVVDSLGCSVSMIVRVRMDTSVPEKLLTIFTPNDDGVNDTFYVRNLPENSKLIITNRWGKEVYSSKNYQNDWKGEGAADGIYFYQISIGDSSPRIGWIEVLRGQKP
jgi:gliding motility-associated-like protein